MDLARILGVLIPLTVVLTGAAWLFSRTLIGEALARRIGGRDRREDGAQIDQLQRDVDALTAQLAEAQERLDFTERVLARPAPVMRRSGRNA